MPADAGVDDARTRGLDRAGQPDHFVVGRAIGDQIDHAEAINQNEIIAHGCAHPGHNFDRQPHPVFIRPAPAVGALVGVGHQKLVQEISLRPHHFDPVIARLAGARGCGDNVGDLFFDARVVQFLGGKGRYGRFHRRRGHAFGTISIAPGVQYLHRDPAVGIMHPVGHDPVVGDVLGREKPRRAGKHAALAVRGHAAGDHQPDPAARPRRVKFGHPVPVAGFFQAGMHRSHQDAVFQHHMPQIEGCQHMRIACHRGLLIAPATLPQTRPTVTRVVRLAAGIIPPRTPKHPAPCLISPCQKYSGVREGQRPSPRGDARSAAQALTWGRRTGAGAAPV